MQTATPIPFPCADTLPVYERVGEDDQDRGQRHQGGGDACMGIAYGHQREGYADHGTEQGGQDRIAQPLPFQVRVSPSSAQAEKAAITGARVMNNWPKWAPMTR